MTIRKGPPVRDGNHAARDFQRGLQTKNIVKGAAGGARGVDYQDHDAEYLERRDSSAAQNAKQSRLTAKTQQSQQKEQLRAVQKEQAANAAGPAAGTPSAPDDQFDPRKVVNQNALQKETPEQKKQRLEAERIKKKILDPSLDDDDDDPGDDDEAAAPDDERSEDSADPGEPAVFSDARVDRLLRKASADVVARLLDDPEVELRLYGTLAVRDGEGMRAAFKTPLRVARHLNVLARRISDGDEGRAAAVHAVADAILALGSGFGRRVLSSFQTGVGIGEIYPLEVMEDIALRSPHFLPHLRLTRFLSDDALASRAGEPLLVRCDPALKITAFALKGGGQPGYAFEPGQEPGCFSLLIDSAGRYRLLLLGVDASKNESLQEVRVHVSPARAGPSDGG